MNLHDEIFDTMKKPFQGLMEEDSKIKIELPPRVFLDMQGKFIEYQRKSLLKVEFPVLERYANPLGNMQGGVIAAAFDNVFGPLSFLIAGKPVMSLDMNVNYIRPIPVGETITITAKLIVRGFSTMNMHADCHNAEGKLAATATTNMLILKVK